ncbi:MAG: sulfite exporter TauE/SafE family protein [Actinomycetota bacterium]|nr:sulfite exporter TauE/SafE family protein [Rubrobacteraceae bacterium]MDQ3791589.1 sulfite exporter TauE/SafE family protein [Actinomycetota bacterium]
MRNLVVLGIVGFIAQLVDGSLGMAYGVTSTTLLLAIAGLTPALASTAVHIAEVGTCAMSGASHWRFGNVDWAKIAWLAIPGGIGAFFGAVVLVSVISAEAAEPIVAIFLFLLGAYVLARFAFNRATQVVQNLPIPRLFLAPLGLIAGFLDAAGGGGWGPISTPTLLSSGRMEPRKVVGTVDTSEFIVALCASIGFLISLSFAQVPWGVVGVLLGGGLIAAPIAAWIVRHLNARVLGTAVGGFILLVNAKTFLEAVGLDPSLNIIVYVAILAVWVTALYFAITALRRERQPVLET